MKKIKISELPLCSTLKGLFTIGTDANNQSVKVSLEFVETKTSQAVSDANTAASNANKAATLADSARKNAETVTESAKTATTNAVKAKESADAATLEANKAATAANKAKTDCDAATEDAQQATEAADDAAEAANNAAGEARSAKEAAEDATKDVLYTLGRLVPTGMSVECITRLTAGNIKPNYIKPVLSPANVMKNVIFISDNKAVSVSPDGRITVVGKGKSTVHVIPTCNTALAKSVLIEVVSPDLRKVGTGGLRLTQSGALRMG